MSEEIVRHQVAIAGRVTDAQTGRAIADAQVEIKDAPAAFKAWLAMRAIQYGDRWEAMPERPDRTRSGADGHFHFLDLPAGQYTLVASLPGAGTRYGQSDEVTVTVSHDTQGSLVLATADLALQPTTLKGRVTNKKGEPVAMAEVRIVGSGERTFSDTGRPDDDTKGDYLLTGLEAGKRTVVVSAQGYSDASHVVTIEKAGQVVTGVDLTLTSSKASRRSSRR